MNNTSTAHHPPPVADREVDRRALHLVDLENLAGGPDHLDDPDGLRIRYHASGAYGHGDLVVVGVDVTNAFAAHATFPGGRLVTGRGPDGADHALIGAVDPRLVPERFTTLVIGSGDHIFAPVARWARNAGLVVEVVSPRAGLSRLLAREADIVHPFTSSRRPRLVVLPSPLRDAGWSAADDTGCAA